MLYTVLYSYRLLCHKFCFRCVVKIRIDFDLDGVVFFIRHIRHDRRNLKLLQALVAPNLLVGRALVLDDVVGVVAASEPVCIDLGPILQNFFLL